MTTNRLVRLAAVSLCAAGVVATTPAWAQPSDVTARSGTGALVARTMSARTVLTSTTGRKLTVSVSATRTSNAGTVTIGVAQGAESHVWSFRARAADVAIGSTGGGTVTLSNTQTGNRGRLSLKLTPKDTIRTSRCGTQVASRTRPVAVAGIAFFKTGTTWGTVGRATRTISLAGANRVTWSYDVTCPAPTPVCARGLSWSTFRSTSTSTEGISGRSNGTTASITAFRSVTLAAPTGASRVDVVTVRSAPVPTFTQDGSSASLTAANGAGRVSIAGGGGFGTGSPCRTGTTTATQQDTTWYGAATNGATPFKVAAQVLGGFSVQDGATASISRQTF